MEQIIEQRTRAVVHLDRLENNIKRVRAALKPGTEIIAVLKGDAYGHGIAGVYPTFRKMGVTSYAVAVWEEGAALRAAGAETENIMLLGDTWDGQLSKLLEYRLVPAIFNLETAAKLNALAKEAGVVCPVEIKINTGMNRIGFPADENGINDICAIGEMENLVIQGAFTHFVSADEPVSPRTDAQFRLYMNVVNSLQRKGIDIMRKHVSNSPAVMLHPELQLDAVRPGDVIFGLCPVPEDIWKTSGIQEVLTWETYAAMVREIPAGEVVGYGATFTAQRPTRVATLPVGFADGYSRRLSNKGFVVINGRKAPVIGRVCMDQMMVDVTEIENVTRGTRVELLGPGFGILDMADTLDANVDEIVCGISKRVPRVYE